MLRTDLAIESKYKEKEYKKSEKKAEYVTVYEMQKEKEKYITLEFGNIDRITDFTPLEKEIKNALFSLLPNNSSRFLVAGLGNREITPDSIGPITCEKLLATRHIAGEFAEKIGLSRLKSVAVISPGVLGKTGIETGEIIRALTEKISPDAVIVIDALAAGSVKRLFSTIQLTNTGISPGSGVKNSRKELSFNTLSVPVIAVGVPTVMTAENLAQELSGKIPQTEEEMIVTPKDNDLLCHRISEILAKALNEALQPETDPEILSALV